MASTVKRSVYLHCADVRDATLRKLSQFLRRAHFGFYAVAFAHWCIIVRPGTHGAYDTHELSNVDGRIEFISKSGYTYDDWHRLGVHVSYPVGETLLKFEEIEEEIENGLSFPSS